MFHTTFLQNYCVSQRSSHNTRAAAAVSYASSSVLYIIANGMYLITSLLVPSPIALFTLCNDSSITLSSHTEKSVGDIFGNDLSLSRSVEINFIFVGSQNIDKPLRFIYVTPPLGVILTILSRFTTNDSAISSALASKQPMMTGTHGVIMSSLFMVRVSSSLILSDNVSVIVNFFFILIMCCGVISQFV